MVRAGPGSEIIRRMELLPYRTLEWPPWRRVVPLAVGGVTHNILPCPTVLSPKDMYAIRQLPY
jgi:hypothetical protein